MLGSIIKNSLVERLSHLAPLAVPRWVLQSVNKKGKVSGAEKQNEQKHPYHSASNMCICCVINNTLCFVINVFMACSSQVRTDPPLCCVFGRTFQTGVASIIE